MKFRQGYLFLLTLSLSINCVYIFTKTLTHPLNQAIAGHASHQTWVG